MFQKILLESCGTVAPHYPFPNENVVHFDTDVL